MKVIKRRIAFQFTSQLILLILLVLAVVLVSLFVMVQFIINSEIKRNYPVGALDTIATETLVEDGNFKMSPGWKRELKEKNMFLEIVDEHGKVVYEINKPAHLPGSYSIKELIDVQESNYYKGFRILTQLDPDSKNQPYLFLLGYEEKNLILLKDWQKEYAKDGLIPKEAKNELEKKLSTQDGYLHIINNSGTIVQSFGNGKKKKYTHIDLIKYRTEPGKYPTDAAILPFANSDLTWVLHINKKDSNIIQPVLIKRILIGLIILSAVLLISTVGVTIWHASRYGQPLQIFISWLDRMGKGQYQEVFTEKEIRKIFNKKGKVRYRYRLYQEVIQGFYDVAEKLTAAAEERKRLESFREEWMTGISHDLRTPLASIQGYGHMLESGHYEWSARELEEMGETIREKSEYMLNLIQDFSVVFQLKNDVLPLSLTSVNIVELAERTVRKFKQDAGTEEGNFTFHTTEKEILIPGDSKWLQRAFDNLIGNAVKHNPPGTKIEVGVNHQNGKVLVMIIDNGTGMNEVTLDNLFDRYYRGSNTEEKAEGLGLGMSIAKEVIHSHGGVISVESALGKGTTIALEFRRV